jgi:tetratricopeptide (TPR) repeat protein
MKSKTLAISILLILFTTTRPFANTEKSNSLVADAWKAWAENNHPQVEAKFISAIKEDRNNTRAYLGLSFLYALEGKDKESWGAFKNILQTEANFYPYVYSAWSTSRMRYDYINPNPDMEALLAKLGEKADSGGVLKAMANEQLGAYYQLKGDIAKSNIYYQKLNAIKDWTLIGPFDNVSASGFDKSYLPEQEYDFAKTYEAKNGIPAKWFKNEAVRNSQWVNLLSFFAHTESVFYANSFVFSPKKQTAQIRVGTTGSLKVFLNDEQLFEYFDETDNDLDTYVVETELQEGWNRVLVKCGLSEISTCTFLARITDAAGEPINGLQLSTEAKPYKRRPGAQFKVVENFAEAFFKAKIKENPADLENYILLADCYLRNDKATEAELTLREAIKLSPACALLYKQILEAYETGKKQDEAATTVEKIYSIDKNIPGVLEYKISEQMENEEFDKAEESIRSLEKLMPGSERVYEFYIDLYGRKEQVDKIIETNKKAFNQYPGNWTFAYIEATISIETTRKYDRAISLIENYLTRQYTETALMTLADLYLKASNVKKWQTTYDKILQIDPANSDTYYQMSNVYFTQQDYASAEKRLKKAIDLCPNSSVYWSRLGEIHRIKNEIPLSKQAYREALKYHPADFEARNVLRELEGKKSIFSLFEAANVETLVKNAPDAKAFPNAGGIVLLQDVKRVVHDRGASESSVELLVKIFNKRGIDSFKEYTIGYNSHTEVLLVEKAVVIKKNGSEIKSDVSENQIVFKTLEEDDIIYLKWNIKNYYSGKLSNHFWDIHYFNSYYPVKNARYSLFVPKDFKFGSNTQNIPNEPVKKQTEDGVIYQWALTDQPAIEYEPGMPGLGDVGKSLYVSSISDWESIVSWYSDLARTKTRSSYEIKEQVEKLFKGKENLTEEERVETIYNFITENIRYSSVPFRQSNLVPQKARDVLVNKIGDCKDVSTLCIAMLNEIGVKAHYVLVNTKDAGQNRNVLPSIPFNHCIVGVETKAGLKYIDLTAYNYHVSSLPETDIDAFSLLIRPGVKTTDYIPRDRSASRTVTHQIIVDVMKDNSISVQNKMGMTGALGAAIRLVLRHKGKEEQDKAVVGILSRDFPGAKLIKFETDNLDELKPAVNMVYNFEVPNYITEASQFKILRVPWSERFSLDNALSSDKRVFPYNYWPWIDKVVEEIEIRVPDGYEPVDFGKETKLTSSIADYSIGFTFSNGVIKGKRQLINKKGVVAPNEYAEFKSFYESVVKEDNRQILLKQK